MKGSLLGIRRLTKEHEDIMKSANPNFVAEPDPDNIFHWHYVIYNLKNCPYEGGYYHGMLKFPPEYPMKPPSVIMITPSGRFECKQRICLTISDWHPEQWNPVWKVESILMGLLSFMLSEEHSVASLHMTEAQRKKFAKDSMAFNLKNKEEPFEKLFEKHYVKLGLKEAPPEPTVLAKRGSSQKGGAGAAEAPAPALEKKASSRKGAAAAKEEEKKEEKKAPAKGAAAKEEKKVPAPKAAAKEEEKKGDPKKRDAKADEKKGAAAIPAAPKDNSNFIYVQCVKVGPKIRLRIVNSTNYNNGWNCQGPRNIRIEGVVYRIDNPKVKVMYGGPGKASFYKLSNDASIYKQVMSGAVG